MSDTNYPTKAVVDIPAGLALEIALYEYNKDTSESEVYTEEDICRHFGITLEYLEKLKLLPSFRQEVIEALKEIKNTNSLVVRKSAIQTQYYVDTLVPLWMHDPGFPPAEKTKLLMFLAKMGRIVDDSTTKKSVEEAKVIEQARPILNLIFSGNGNPSPTTITVEQGKVIDAKPEED